MSYSKFILSILFCGVGALSDADDTKVEHILSCNVFLVSLLGMNAKFEEVIECVILVRSDESPDPQQIKSEIVSKVVCEGR